mmetsp:Transcript_24612/g.37924  ORF Transcript_24612/g.37924 Transcript_24612/m.37924 type:complete len:236 (-) Transcript_24612:115-822(-)
MRTSDTPTFSQICQERYGLQRFTQSHFIGQNPVDAVIVQLNHPIESLQLVAVHFTVRGKIGGLLVQTDSSPFRLGRLQQLRILFGFRHASTVRFFILSLLFATGCHRPREKVCKHIGLCQEITQSIFLGSGTLIPESNLGLFGCHEFHPFFPCFLEFFNFLFLKFVRLFVVFVFRRRFVDLHGLLSAAFVFLFLLAFFVILQVQTFYLHIGTFVVIFTLDIFRWDNLHALSSITH